MRKFKFLYTVNDITGINNDFITSVLKLFKNAEFYERKLRASDIFVFKYISYQKFLT